MNQNQQLIAWLTDASSMERALAKVLENHVEDAIDVPEVHARLTEHLPRRGGMRSK